MPDQKPPHLSILVMDGSYDRVHYALVVASAGAAIGRPATLLFTGKALYALCRQAPGGGAGWHGLATSGGTTAAETDQILHARGVADFETLLSACAELGVRFLACETGLRANDLTPSQLREDITIELAGVVSFLNDAPDSELSFVF